MDRLLVDPARQAGVADLAVASLPQVIWRRRHLVMLALAVAIVLAFAYLKISTRVYRATAKVVIQQNAPHTLQMTRDNPLASESFLQTQVEGFVSIPILTRALAAATPAIPRTLAGMNNHDPVSALRDGKALTVEQDKKADVVLVSMDSPYPQEAVALVNAVVDSYIAEQTLNREAVSDGMLKAVRKEKAEAERKRDDLVSAMQRYRRENGIMELRDAGGNTILERASALSVSLTTAEAALIEAKADLTTAKAALVDPNSVAAFVESQQQKNRDAGDRELDDLRSQLLQYRMSLTSSGLIQGPRNQHVKVLLAAVDELRNEIQEKEREMAEAAVTALQMTVTSAEQKVNDVRDALKIQTSTVLGLSPETYANAQADVGRLEKSLDVLDGRITELTVNKTTDTGPLDINVIERAALEEKPVKPNTAIALAIALFAGGLGGVGLAVARDSTDLRLRSSEEVRSLLSLRMIGAVPPIPGDVSAVARGQIVRLDARSAVAEAYRSVRTALHLGTKLASKTLVFVSPCSGDGKSTTASNVAIAFAQSGERTLLMDCDLREPVQHLIFEVEGGVGLTDVISGSAQLKEAVCATDVPGLFVLPCGPLPTNPSELLAGRRFGQMIRALGKKFDRIVIDSPPLLNVTDGSILAAASDVTVLVLRMGASTREGAAIAVDHLEKVGANIAGVVANGVPTPRTYRYYGTASMYATHAQRRISSQNQLATADHVRRAEQEILAIEEPNWTADN